MIIAALLVGIGLLVGAWAATTRGYRLSGVVVVALLAIYTLVDFVALPVFILSSLLAYLGIKLVQNWWLLYGRQLILTAILLGAIIPVASLLVLEFFIDSSVVINDLHYLGSILPGIAAYNYHRLDPERRVPELLASGLLFLGLFVVGVLAVVQWSRPSHTMERLIGISPGDYMDPILLNEGSDVAGFLGLTTVDGPTTVGSLGAVTVVVIFGLAVGELQRDRWGLEPVGVIALPLLALFALRAWWVLPVYVVVTVLTFAAIQTVHNHSLLYGRALLSVGVVFGIVLAIPIMTGFGLADDLAVFFTGFLAGIGAYNFHRVTSGDRLESAIVTAGSFVVVFALARALIEPLPDGLGTSISWPHVLVSVLVLVLAGWVVFRFERFQLSKRTLRATTRFHLGGEQ